MLFIDDPKYRETCRVAIAKWGEQAQKMMAVGECGEFLAEFGREEQGRSSPEKVIDEIADVIVMMNQMALLYGADEVKERIKFKMAKVRNKLGLPE